MYFNSFYLLYSYNPSFLICLCFHMVSFRDQNKLGPRPDRSPLGGLIQVPPGKGSNEDMLLRVARDDREKLASRVLRQPPKCFHNLNNVQPWHSCLFLTLKNWPPWLVPGSCSFPVANYDLYRAAKERPGEATVLRHLGEGDDWKERRKRKSSVLFPLLPTSFLKSLPPCAPLKRTPNNNKQTTVWDSNDSNKTGMESVLSRDLFYLDFFGAAAEFRLGFAFRSMLDRISWRFDSK